MCRLFISIALILSSFNTYAYWLNRDTYSKTVSITSVEQQASACIQAHESGLAQIQAEWPSYMLRAVTKSCLPKSTYVTASAQVQIWIQEGSDDACPPDMEGVTDPQSKCSLPPPPSCDDPDLQKEIQHAHHACQLSMPESEFFSNVFRWWCENGDVYTYCGLEPKNCIQGLTCTRPDDDVVLCDPSKQECALPEPDPDTPGTPNDPIIPDIEITNPDEPPENFCEIFPEQCLEPEPPQDPDLPNPDPEDPDNPQNETNNYLGNIHSTLDDFRDKQLLDNQLYKQWQQHMLGQMREVNNSLRNGVGGGGAGGVAAAVGEGNLKLAAIGETLEDIKCELSQGCEGQETPTANINCEQNIFECQGDVIQCANLKLQFEDFCPAQELAELEGEVNRVFGDDRTGELVESDVLDFANIDSQYLSSGVSFGNSTCPSPHTFSFTHFAGTTSVEVSYEPACEYARSAAPIHIVLAWIAGLFLIGRTQGAF